MNSPAEDLFLSLLASGQLDRRRARLLLDGCANQGHITHDEFFATAVATVPDGSRRTYRTGFKRLVTEFGTVSLADVSTSDLDAMCASLLISTRASGRTDGTGAVRGFISACRFWYALAVRQGHRFENPATDLVMPARRRRVRRALSSEELTEVYRIVGSTGNDPVLDLLILDFHRETAARMGGALQLRLCDINPSRGSVLLREKYGHEREVPASQQLLDRLLHLNAQRSTSHSAEAILRYRSGQCLTRRRYNNLFSRVHSHLGWSARLGVSIHWLRHTTLTDISNACGSRIAAAYAGHSDRTVTDVYTTPTFEDLQIAHALVFSQLEMQQMVRPLA